MTTTTPAGQGRDVDLLAAILRGEVLPSSVVAALDADALYQSAIDHDILPLLAAQSSRQPALPAALQRRLQEDAQGSVVVDLLREVELKRALAALAAAGVRPLVVKGSHLAYTHYKRPDLRSRIDSDLLVPAAMRDVADAILTGALGYEASTKVAGDLSATQQTYTRRDPDVLSHQFDLHWRLASPQVFAHVLSYEELWASSVPLPQLGPVARGPSSAHALVIACIHRVAHHDDAEELKWFVDIDLIASGLSAEEWEAFLILVADRHVGAVCRHSLLRTVELLHTAIPAHVLDDARLKEREASLTAGYLRPRTPARLVADDLRALSSWRDRAKLLSEHLLPSAVYMRTMYAPQSRLPLPLLYAVRVARGAGRWLGLTRRP